MYIWFLPCGFCGDLAKLSCRLIASLPASVRAFDRLTLACLTSGAESFTSASAYLRVNQDSKPCCGEGESVTIIPSFARPSQQEVMYRLPAVLCDFCALYSSPFRCMSPALRISVWTNESS